MVKIGKRLRLERETIAKEMQDAVMSADINHLAERRCMTPRMVSILHRLYDWAERAAND